MSTTPKHGPLDTGADGTLPQISSPSTTGKGWTGETLLSFHYFPKLPPEIRVKVWSYCVLEPRVLELEPNPRHDEVITHHPTPAYLQVCRESRFEGSKVYELFGAGPSDDYARIWINFEVDTVIFTSKIFDTFDSVALAVHGMQIQHEKILKLGIHYSGCMNRNSFNEDVAKCSRLQKLYLAFDNPLGTERLGWVPQGTTAVIVSIGSHDCVEFDLSHRDPATEFWDFLAVAAAEKRGWDYLEGSLIEDFNEKNGRDSDSPVEFGSEIDEMEAGYTSDGNHFDFQNSARDMHQAMAKIQDQDAVDTAWSRWEEHCSSRGVNLDEASDELLDELVRNDDTGLYQAAKTLSDEWWSEEVRLLMKVLLTTKRLNATDANFSELRYDNEASVGH